MVRTATLIGLAMALASCDSVPQTWSRDAIEEIAADAADDNSGVDIGMLEARLSDIETKATEQESQISDLELEIASLRSETAAVQSEMSSHEMNGHY